MTAFLIVLAVLLVLWILIAILRHPGDRRSGGSDGGVSFFYIDFGDSGGDCGGGGCD